MSRTPIKHDTLRPLEVPRLALRLLAPYLAVMMTSTLHVSNASARRELGWTASIPTYGDGIRLMRAAPREVV